MVRDNGQGKGTDIFSVNLHVKMLHQINGGKKMKFEKLRGY